MADRKSRTPALRGALIAVVVISLIISCMTCGCISNPFGPDNGAYQPPTFEPTPLPTVHPTDIPAPTMVCELPVNQTPPAGLDTVPPVQE